MQTNTLEMRKDLDNNKRAAERKEGSESVEDWKDPILPKQVIFSSDTTYIYIL